MDHAVQIFAAEHFGRVVQPWSCSAAPVHDPLTGRLLGAIDLTGGDAVAAPVTLALVRATAAAVEAELAVRALPLACPAGAPTERPDRRGASARHASRLLTDDELDALDALDA